MFYDHDVFEIVSHHVGHGLVKLYLVLFLGVNIDVRGEDDSVDEEEEEEYKRHSVYINDDFWWLWIRWWGLY